MAYGIPLEIMTKVTWGTGISDWAVHFKTGTHSEYVIITVKGGHNG